ncbi:hypothetical protein GW932_03460 [archaeon]|nr:hypothetical protein [archaeon]
MKEEIKMKIKYVDKKKIKNLSGFANFETETVYVDKDLIGPIKRFVLEHEKYHIKDYKKLKIKGKEQSLFMWEFKATIYAFVRCPFGGILVIIRNLYPPRLISFLKFYFFKNEKRTREIARELMKKNV